MERSDYKPYEKLQIWAVENEPGDQMIYKSSWWGHIKFVRDTILNMLYVKKNDDREYSEIMEYMGEQYDIIGTHTSKSVKLPVYEFRYKGATIVMRYNFYDFQVTIDSSVKLDIPMDLLDSYSYLCLEGFPQKYIDKPLYPESKTTFSCSISSSYKFYTFLFLIKQQLDQQ